MSSIPEQHEPQPVVPSELSHVWVSVNTGFTLPDHIHGLDVRSAGDRINISFEARGESEAEARETIAKFRAAAAKAIAG